MPTRDLAAVRCFLVRAIGQHNLPDKVIIDKSGANTAAVKRIRADTGAPTELREVKYLNNIVEQDHRAIKRIIRPVLGFQSFRCVRILLMGIETMHMNKKGNLTASTGKLRLPHTSSIHWLPDRSPLLTSARSYSLIATEPLFSKWAKTILAAMRVSAAPIDVCGPEPKAGELRWLRVRSRVLSR
jgi:hypothetical protein